MGKEEVEKEKLVISLVISNEDFEKYFNKRIIINKKDIENYYANQIKNNY